MYQSKLLKWLLASFTMFAVDDDNGGGKVDDGSDFVPTDDDEEAAKATAEKEAAEKEAAEKEAAEKEAAEKAEKEAAEAKGEEGDKGGKDDKSTRKDTRIPLARHKELLEKERDQRTALEAELAKYRGGEKLAATNEEITASENKVVELDEKYAKLIADGELEKAAGVMRDIRKLERSISDHRADMKAAAAESRAYERVRYDTVVDRIEASYPVMNPDHDDYDKTQVAEVLELKDAYQLKGLPPSEALQKAVKYVLGAATGKQKTAVEVDPNLDKEAVEKAAKEEKSAARKEEAVKKGIDAATKTPPSTAKVGMDSDKAGGGAVDAKAVMKMSQSDFAKLDEKELSRLRGDTVE